VKVGFYSPLPPARTGVADYSSLLLSALRAVSTGDDVEVNAANADVNLYHIGNNQLHLEIYRQALERPGVVVLHDAVLHHFFLGTLSEAEYISEFTYNYGPWTEDLARELWRRRARSAADAQYFRYPMLRRIAQRSRSVVVHNPAAAAMVKQHVPDAVIHEIPHLFQAPELPPPYDVIRTRQQLGVPAQTFLFAVFGHLRESKRLPAILRAFHRARQSASMTLLISGEFASTDLARSLEPLLQAGGILRAGYAEERDFWLRASVVDACVSLRYPTAGETSGIAIRLMGIGKPVLLSAGCETARFPDSACIKIDGGMAEDQMLTESMIWLARYPSDARVIGERAAEHIREFHNPQRVAKLYWKALVPTSPVFGADR